jgi:hypothetical protein
VNYLQPSRGPSILSIVPSAIAFFSENVFKSFVASPFHEGLPDGKDKNSLGK